jgi:RHS repeat-associated protein
MLLWLTPILHGASNSNSYQFTRRENDGAGLYYYRARYYSPASQRFLSEDPILAPMNPLTACTFSSISTTTWLLPVLIKDAGLGEDASTITSVYAYTDNNPLKFSDPTGLMKKNPFPDCFDQTVFASCLKEFAPWIAGFGSLCIAFGRYGVQAFLGTCGIAGGLVLGCAAWAAARCF